MRRRWTIAVATALCLAPVIGTGQQAPSFRAETELVTFGVTVVDRRGGPVTGLSQEDFTLVEDGARQTLSLFARGEVVDADAELHVGLLLDASGSMGRDIELARSAAIRFLNTLTDARDITLVDFDSEVRVSKYGQRDFPRIVERIRGRAPAGMTALYDALAVYLRSAAEDDGRTILVMYTDGGDTRSAARYTDILEAVRASDATIHVVGFLEHQPRSVQAEQRLRLRQIAEAAGGRAIFPLSIKEVEAAYDSIVAQIRSQYTVGYVSTNPAHDGRWREVRITVAQDGGPRVQVRSRRGYFARYQKPPPSPSR